MIRGHSDEGSQPLFSRGPFGLLINAAGSSTSLPLRPYSGGSGVHRKDEPEGFTERGIPPHSVASADGYSRSSDHIGTPSLVSWSSSGPGPWISCVEVVSFRTSFPARRAVALPLATL